MNAGPDVTKAAESQSGIDPERMHQVLAALSELSELPLNLRLPNTPSMQVIRVRACHAGA